MAIFTIFRHPVTKKYAASKSSNELYYLAWIFPVFWQVSKKMWTDAFIALIAFFLFFPVSEALRENGGSLENILNMDNGLALIILSAIGMVLYFYTIKNSGKHYTQLLIKDGHVKIKNMQKGDSENDAIQQYIENRTADDLLNENNSLSQVNLELSKGHSTEWEKEPSFFEKYDIKSTLITYTITSFLGVFVYLITHHVFGFGVTEASVSSVIAALVLGTLGYKA